MLKDRYDVFIIGGGPAGLSAALYAARADLKTAVTESETLGGLITSTDIIENYPGAEDGITGYSLADRMLEQAEKAGAQILSDKIVKLEKTAGGFLLTGLADSYEAKTVILATGSHPNLLNIPGELEFRGRGVSYCATCDAGFFRNKEVLVIGGGDSAIKEADYLTKFASKVTVIHRRNELRASAAVKSKALYNEKIAFIYNSQAVEIVGEGTVKAVTLRDVQSGKETEQPCDGVFIFAGYSPNSSFDGIDVPLDEQKRVITNSRLMTKIEGIFAAGDVRDTVLKQVITAAADGATAATQAEEYLRERVWFYE